ncbi:MAG: glucokinase [Acidobacteria bacterium]|nr:glucokinase [Acidobacteriota bacterium]
MLLAGDIGGTKTLLGLFDPRTARPRPIAVREFATLDFTDLPAMIAEFLRDAAVENQTVDSACFGVAGPVIDEAADLTNVPWRVDARQVASAFKLTRVRLLNDLQAMAYAVPVLRSAEVHALQEGEALRGGNIALIAAGTGLGEALLHHVDGRFIPSPSEGGHADFPARTDREFALACDLIARHGRADVEHVLSGRGFVNLHRVTHQGRCAAGIDLDDPDAPAQISAAGLERRCAGCVEALEMFVQAYGAEAGNLALRMVATGGVFVGGGIAPKILPALTTGAFMQAFNEKPPLTSMLEAIPVKVILNAEAGLLGAAVYAAGL